MQKICILLFHNRKECIISDQENQLRPFDIYCIKKERNILNDTLLLGIITPVLNIELIQYVKISYNIKPLARQRGVYLVKTVF